jgi:hypothetical protein
MNALEPAKRASNIIELLIAAQHPGAADPTSDQMLESLTGVTAVKFDPGDYVKFEIRDEKSSE